MAPVDMDADGRVYMLDAPKIVVLESMSLRILREFVLEEPLSAYPGMFSKDIRSIAVGGGRIFAGECAVANSNSMYLINSQ